MRALGTAITPSLVFKNLRECANHYGQTTVTCTQFNNYGSKVCSYSHIYNQLGMSWNECLYRAGLAIKKDFDGADTGRKIKDTTNSDMISCLRCDKIFASEDRKYNRICNPCKKQNERVWDW